MLPDLNARSEKLDDATSKHGSKRLKGAIIQKMLVFQALVSLTVPLSGRGERV